MGFGRSHERGCRVTNPLAMQSIPLPDGAIAWTRDGVHWFRLQPHPSGGVRMTRMDAPTIAAPVSETPQTDALVEEGGLRDDADFARRLERQRNAAIVEVARLVDPAVWSRPRRADRVEANGCVYCPRCDHEITTVWISESIAPNECRCPKCNGAAISEFYSIGSFTHIERRKAWTRGEIKGCPPPLPRETP